MPQYSIRLVRESHLDIFSGIGLSVREPPPRELVFYRNADNDIEARKLAQQIKEKLNEALPDESRLSVLEQDGISYLYRIADVFRKIV